jgi:hypothetical protein
MDDRDEKPCPLCGEPGCPDWGDCWKDLDDDVDEVCKSCWDSECPGCD